MASARKRILTYHVAPRFDIAAQGGPLELGTVVADLQRLRPLNRGHVIPIHSELRYPPVPHTGFRETRSNLCEGEFGVWAKVLSLGLGGSAKAGGKKDAGQTVSCEGVVTTYFDPDDGYVARCLAAKPVNDFIVGSGYEADVYMVTGLKVAKGLVFGDNVSSEARGEVEVSAQPPATDVEAGVRGKMSGEKKHELEFTVDDIVVGFRVTRYRYVSASMNPFSKKKKLVEDEYLDGAEMMDDKVAELKEPRLEFEAVPLDEEAVAEEKALAKGETEECWVEPT